MSSGWALPVQLLPDELLSSWLARAALMQGCDPLVLTGAIWPRWRVWTVDVDRGLTEAQLSTLSRLATIEASRFEDASLRQAASVISSQPLEKLSVWPWILAQGSRNRKRHSGLQYCPSCLREDEHPYFRRHWRFAWHIGCVTHGCQLVDLCPTCAAPLEPHRLSATDCHLAICATCRADLRKIDPRSAHPQGLAFQKAADEVLMLGFGLHGDEHLLPARWFKLCRYYVAVLRRAAASRTSRTGVPLNIASAGLPDVRTPATGLALELLPVGERAMLLGPVLDSLALGSETSSAPSGNNWATEAGSRLAHQLMQEAPSTMKWPRARGSTELLRRPRSRQTVQRMFARLQRKMRVSGR